MIIIRVGREGSARMMISPAEMSAPVMVETETVISETAPVPPEKPAVAVMIEIVEIDVRRSKIGRVVAGMVSVTPMVRGVTEKDTRPVRVEGRVIPVVVATVVQVVVESPSRIRSRPGFPYGHYQNTVPFLVPDIPFVLFKPVDERYELLALGVDRSHLAFLDPKVSGISQHLHTPVEDLDEGHRRIQIHAELRASVRNDARIGRYNFEDAALLKPDLERRIPAAEQKLGDLRAGFRIQRQLGEIELGLLTQADDRAVFELDLGKAAGECEQRKTLFQGHMGTGVDFLPVLLLQDRFPLNEIQADGPDPH